MSIKELKLYVISKIKQLSLRLQFFFLRVKFKFHNELGNYASIGIIFLNTTLCISLIKRSKVSRFINWILWWLCKIIAITYFDVIVFLKKPNSTNCNQRGTYECGVCHCNEGWSGESCQCDQRGTDTEACGTEAG